MSAGEPPAGVSPWAAEFVRQVCAEAVRLGLDPGEYDRWTVEGDRVVVGPERPPRRDLYGLLAVPGPAAGGELGPGPGRDDLGGGR